MHIPDGFLDAKTAATTGVLAIGGITLAVRQLRRQLPPQRVPLLGLSAAFVFAAQMLNFPVAGGTSGHLVGSTLIAVLLGPGAAVLVLAAVLIVQCFVFADGGLLALGANIFNMGVVAGVGGYVIYRGVQRLFGGTRGVVMGAAFAAWCATVLAAVFCAGELAMSGMVAWSVVFPALVNVHLLIGLGEALITSLAVITIHRTRPELIEPSMAATTALGYKQVLGYGLLISLGLALFVSPFACPWPDGLEKVAGAFGFGHRAVSQPLVSAPMPDYQLSGIKSATFATSLAGVIGTVVVFGVSFVLAHLLVPRTVPPERTE
jgi:cobalt/nickel transport system permease protein